MLDEVQLGLGGVVTEDTVVVAAFTFDPALMVLQMLWRTKQRDVNVLFHPWSPGLVHCKLLKATWELVKEPHFDTNPMRQHQFVPKVLHTLLLKSMKTKIH